MGTALPVAENQDFLLEESDSSPSNRVKMAAATAVLTSSAIAGRVALQHVPSVEPIIAVAVALGFYGNWRHGAFAGASAFFLSNFLVWGGQGPWTLFQVLGAASAGVTGGVASKFSGGREMFFTSVISGALLFELAVNIGYMAYSPLGVFGIASLAAAVPFGFIHIASSVGFGSMLYGVNSKIEAVYRRN